METSWRLRGRVSFRNDSGKRTYIITTRRMTSGDELKQRNGLGDFALDFCFMDACYLRQTRSATLVCQCPAVSSRALFDRNYDNYWAGSRLSASVRG